MSCGNGMSETGFDWAAFDRVMGDSCDGLLDKFLQEKEKQRAGLPPHLYTEDEELDRIDAELGLAGRKANP